jgi:predicted nucleotidyltransferase
MAQQAEPAATVLATGAFGLPAAAVRKLQGLFEAEPAIRRALVYGSRALGRHRPASDIDIALDAPDLPFPDFLRLVNAIDDLLLPWQVDLVLLSQIDNPQLVAHIARVGRPLLERSPPTC